MNDKTNTTGDVPQHLVDRMERNSTGGKPADYHDKMMRPSGVRTKESDGENRD